MNVIFLYFLSKQTAQKSKIPNTHSTSNAPTPKTPHLPQISRNSKTLKANKNQQKTNDMRNKSDDTNLKISLKHLPFLSSGVPNLGLKDLIIDPNTSGGEFDSDCRFGFKAKLVLRKSRQQIRFTNTRISNQHHLEQIIVVVVRSIRRHLGSPGRVLLSILKKKEVRVF